MQPLHIDLLGFQALEPGSAQVPIEARPFHYFDVTKVHFVTKVYLEYGTFKLYFFCEYYDHSAFIEWNRVRIYTAPPQNLCSSLKDDLINSIAVDLE